MPLGGVEGWQVRFSDQAPVGALVAVVCALILAIPSIGAQPEDPPPSEEDLLTLPGPEASELGPAADPFQIVPTLPESIRVTGDFSLAWDAAQEIVHYKGDVQVRADNGIQLFADEAVADLKNKFIRFIGNVSVYQGAVLHRGETAIYHFEEERLEADGLRSGMDPILLEAGRFRMVEHEGQQYFIGEDAGVTTNDRQHPSFWARAEKTVVLPDDRVIFRNVKFYVGETPVFWLPFLSQPLNRELGYRFVPGARSNLGPYLLNRYGIMLGGEHHSETGERRGAWLLSQWHLDFFSRRGIGTGVDLFDTRLGKNPNLGWLKLYFLGDRDPTLDRIGEDRRDVDAHRFRAQLRYRLEFDDLIPGGETWLDADFTLLSDPSYLEDFDPATFRLEPNPDNVLSLTHQRDRNLFTFWTRIRPNSFYQSDTRVPEFALDQVRHPLFGGPVLHEGQTTFGIYDEYLPDFQRRNLRAEAAMLPPNHPPHAEINGLLVPRGFTRFHTWQEISIPLVIDNWLNLVPRAGLGYTAYLSVDGNGRNSDRTHLFAGVDASVKFSKEFPEVESEALGLDGLLHVVQPYASASWLATGELDASLPRIDRLTATTRPRPLGVGRFSAIDSFNDWAIVRLGARNRLLTRRDGGTHEWLTLDSYFDWFLDDPEFNRTFSNFYNDLHFHPLPWLEIGLETQFPLLDKLGDFTEVAASLRYMPTEDTQVTVRNRILNNHPLLQNSSRFEYDVYHRFNEDWGAGLIHRWEFSDGTLELQQYSINRTMESWAISLGVFHRDSRDESEFGFVLGFTLRDFPSVNLPLQLDSE